MSEPQAGDNKLKSIVSRINSLMDDRDSVSADIRDVFTEAKADGFDVPALRAIIRAQREDIEKRKARETMVDIYRDKLGIG